MRRLYFGGSFNPIHHGHLVCSRTIAEAANFDQVVLFPTPDPPHKPESVSLALIGHRFAMTRIAIAAEPLFVLSELELSRTGPSYTIDTVRQLHASGEDHVHWLIGADMLMYLPKWRQAGELLKEVTFVVMARPGWTMDWETLPPPFRALRSHVVGAPELAISATEIRARVAAGRSIRYLTPDGVCDYIREHELYQTPAST